MMLLIVFYGLMLAPLWVMIYEAPIILVFIAVIGLVVVGAFWKGHERLTIISGLSRREIER